MGLEIPGSPEVAARHLHSFQTDCAPVFAEVVFPNHLRLVENYNSNMSSLTLGMLEQVASTIRSSRWEVEFTSVLPRIGLSELNSSDVVRLAEFIRAELDLGHAGRARNWIALGLFLNQTLVLQELQRKGIFRSSRFMYRSKKIAWIVEEILNSGNDLVLSTETIKYFESIQALLSLARHVLETYDFVCNELRRRGNVALKSLTATVDLLFLKGKSGDREQSSDTAAFYSQEDMAEALSFLAYLINRQTGIHDEQFKSIDEKGIHQGTYDRLLLSACKIKAFNEAELMIDAFGYTATNRNGAVVIEAPEPSLEKSIRLGYIQTTFQYHSDIVRALSEELDNVMSLGEFAKQLHEKFGHELIRLVEHPAPRFVMVLPEAPEMFAPFRDDGMYKEDVLYLKRVSKDNYVSVQTLLDWSLGGKLRISDLIKIQRLFGFFRSMMGHSFEPVLKTDIQLVLRSILPVFQKERFLEILAYCVGMDSARSFLELTQYGVDSEGVFDIQYRPVIAGEEYLMLPVNILASSNLLRNLLYTQRQKVRGPSVVDVMPHIVARAFSQQKLLAADAVKLKVDEVNLEIDVVARAGDSLIVCECKTAYHPCGAHELRTSYEHIEKASRQLDRLHQVLLRPENQKRLYDKLKWVEEPTLKVITCIVTGNRLFNGHRMNGHPVRQAYELVNAITGGTVTLMNDEFRVWESETFAADDILNYIAGTTTTTDFFESMDEKTLEYKFGSGRLTLRTYALDLNKLHERTSSRYPRVGNARETPIQL